MRKSHALEAMIELLVELDLLEVLVLLLEDELADPLAGMVVVEPVTIMPPP